VVDKNIIVMTGTWAAASARAIGQSGRSLTELRLRVTRPGKKGEGETAEVVPCIIWDGTLGAVLLDLAPGTPLTVIGRISAREWQAPGGQTKTFVEVVGESVTVDAAAMGAPSETAPVARPVVAPAVQSRPAGARPASSDSVPF
jgi:single-stranded DNA-binding protein